MSGTTAPTASFLVVVPPGWARLPAGEEDRGTLHGMIRDIIEHAMPADLPRDRAEPLRQEMRKRLMSTVVEAGDNGATAAYLPVRPVDGYTPPVSILESEVEDDSDMDPEKVIAQILTDALPDRIDPADTGLRAIDGSIAARTESTLRRVRPASDLPEIDDRRVTYTIPVPHRPGRWVIMSFSAISKVAAPTGNALGQPTENEQITDALVALFDAIMTTFRWTDVPGVNPTTLEQRLDEIGQSQ